MGFTGKEKLSPAESQDLKQFTREIEELNEGLLPQYVHVPRGTKLHLPGKRLLEVEQDTKLGDIARSQFGNAEKAQLLYDDNKDSLKLPAELPAGAALKIPQGNEPALIAFGVLTLFLILVSVGILLRPSNHQSQAGS